jgi:hypothetical protein
MGSASWRKLWKALKSAQGLGSAKKKFGGAKLLLLEPLESRINPGGGGNNVLYWSGHDSTSWDLKTNWSTVPNPGYFAATAVPGVNDTAIFQGVPDRLCDITANETVGQLDVDGNYPKDNLKIESGFTLTLTGGTAFSGIGQEIIVLGTLTNTGGTMSDTGGNLIGSGEIVLNGGGMSFVNSAQVTVQTTISVDWGGKD